MLYGASLSPVSAADTFRSGGGTLKKLLRSGSGNAGLLGSIKPNSKCRVSVFSCAEQHPSPLLSIETPICHGSQQPVWNVEQHLTLTEVEESFQFFVQGYVDHVWDHRRKEVVLGAVQFGPVSLLDCLRGKTIYSPIVSKEIGGGEIAIHCLFVSETAPFRTKIETLGAFQHVNDCPRELNVKLPRETLSFDQSPVQDVMYEFSHQPGALSLLSTASIELLVEGIFESGRLPGTPECAHEALQCFMQCHCLYFDSPEAFASMLWARFNYPGVSLDVEHLSDRACSGLSFICAHSSYAKPGDTLAVIDNLLKLEPFRSTIDSERRRSILDQLGVMPNSAEPEKVIALHGTGPSDVRVQDLVEQITLIDYGYFSAIQPWELLRQRWILQSLSGVQKFSNWSNHLHGLVITEILRASSPLQRESAFLVWKDVMHQLLKIGNYASCVAIAGALGGHCVERSFSTHPQWKKQWHLDVKKVLRLFGPASNFKAYRTMEADAVAPFIPFFGVHLSDFIFADEGNPNFVCHGSLVNLEKARLLCSLLSSLFRGGEKPFTFPVLRSVQSVLLNYQPMDLESLDGLSRLHTVRIPPRLKRSSSKDSSQGDGLDQIRNLSPSQTDDDSESKLSLESPRDVILHQLGVARHPFHLDGPTAREMAAFLQQFPEESAAGNQVIVRQGEFRRECYILTEGDPVHLLVDGKIVGVAECDVFLGELALILDSFSWAATVIATANGCRFRRVTASAFMEFVSSNLTFGFRWLIHLARAITKDCNYLMTTGHAMTCYDPQLHLLYPQSVHNPVSGRLRADSLSHIIPADQSIVLRLKDVAVNGSESFSEFILTQSSLLIISSDWGQDILVKIAISDISLFVPRRDVELEIQAGDRCVASTVPFVRMQFGFSATLVRDGVVEQLKSLTKEQSGGKEEMVMRWESSPEAIGSSGVPLSTLVVTTPSGIFRFSPQHPIDSQVKLFLAGSWSRIPGSQEPNDSEHLRNSGVQCQFDAADWSSLMSSARTISFEKGEPIISAGRKVKYLYILRKGRCNVCLDNGQRVGVVNPGEIFGETSFLASSAEHYVPVVSVIATTRSVECSVLGKHLISILLSRNSKFAYDFGVYLCALVFGRASRGFGERESHAPSLQEHDDIPRHRKRSWDVQGLNASDGGIPIPIIPPELLSPRLAQGEGGGDSSDEVVLESDW